ncbi:hypothetical protein BO85DRAFT_308260 [Aspergillus piperis CBS 112811]|uniref:Uncharacterized protein n=1 Tax=Aspergillus piperis CBS 112811 TaxID=1448313 RepID=A0A8G1R086_9EURO|nr:hypothetical protein BO85DRAFT_308260 [Aspergillus piperis CBS 112811]RAH57686.1 hypothetical protein BO85DRAFT_308260 [Aspergillus piperis CBS 112811]
MFLLLVQNSPKTKTGLPKSVRHTARLPLPACASATLTLFLFFFRPFLAPEIIPAFYGTRHKKHRCGGEQKNNNTLIELLIARDKAYQLVHNRITLISTFIYIQRSYHHSFCVITSCTN